MALRLADPVRADSAGSRGSPHTAVFDDVAAYSPWCSRERRRWRARASCRALCARVPMRARTVQAVRRGRRSSPGGVRQPPVGGGARGCRCGWVWRRSSAVVAFPVTPRTASFAKLAGRRIRLEPFGVPGQLERVLLLLPPPEISADVEADISMAPVLRCRRGDDGPAVARRIVRGQDCPAVEGARRCSVPRTFGRPSGQFHDGRVIHPVDRDRNGFLALQKDIHVDLALACTVASPSREDSSSESLGTVDLRRQGRRHLHGTFHRFGKSSVVAAPISTFQAVENCRRGTKARNCAITKSSGRSAEAS